MLKGHMSGNREGSSAVGKTVRGIRKLTWEEGGFLRPIDSHKMGAEKENWLFIISKVIVSLNLGKI